MNVAIMYVLIVFVSSIKVSQTHSCPRNQSVLYRRFAGAGTVFLPIGHCTWPIGRRDGTKWLAWVGQEGKPVLDTKPFNGLKQAIETILCLCPIIRNVSTGTRVSIGTNRTK